MKGEHVVTLAPLSFAMLPPLGFAFSLLFNGLAVTVLAIIVVLARVLWPKETMQRWQNDRRFRMSVGEMRQGLERLEDEQYDAALQLFALAARKTPNKPAPVLLRVYALGLQGRHHEAASELRQAMMRWSPDTLPKRLVALAYVGAGNYDRAYTNAVAAAAQEPIAPIALRTLGDVCRLVERYPEAERAYLRGIEMGLPNPYAGLAWVLACQGRVAEAEAELAKAPLTTMILFESQLTLGQIHLQARRLEEAQTIFESLLKAHGTVPRVLVPYGLTLLEDVQMARAVEVLERAVKIAPDDPFACCALAEVQVECNDLAGATANAREALRLWPGYGRARSVYADVLKRSGRYAAAEEQYREALRLNPFLADAHARLAALLRTRGMREEAREHEREAHRLRPSMPLALSQKMLAVTTQDIANGTMPMPVPSSQPRQSVPADVNMVLTPTAKRLPLRSMEVSAQATRPSVPVARPSGPALMSDIAAFPGAALVSDESRESVFSQTLHVAQLPDVVLAFYRRRMAVDGWSLVLEGPSSVSYLRGITLTYQRGPQTATVTIGVRPPATGMLETTLEDHPTFIITNVTHRLN
jgi:tetratricopeptide (TPR) repeat protein